MLNYWQIEEANPPVIVHVFEIDIDVHVDDSAVVNFLQLFAGQVEGASSIGLVDINIVVDLDFDLNVDVSVFVDID